MIDLNFDLSQGSSYLIANIFSEIQSMEVEFNMEHCHTLEEATLNIYDYNY